MPEPITLLMPAARYGVRKVFVDRSEVERLCNDVAENLDIGWSGEEFLRLTRLPHVAPLIDRLLLDYVFERDALINALEPEVGATSPGGNPREFATIVADAFADLVQQAKQGDELARYLAHTLTERVQALRELRVEDEEALARVRRLSALALRDAARVGVGRDQDDNEAPALLDGEIPLWVERHIEAEVQGLLADHASPCIVVEGLAGAGKTSLLWHVAESVRAWPHAEPFFVKATALVGAHTSAGTAPATIDSVALSRAARAARALGRRPIVLLDTVDLLLHSEAGRDVVLELISSLLEEESAVVAACRGMEAAQLGPVRTHAKRLGGYDALELDAAIVSHVRRFYGPGRTADARVEHARVMGLVAQGRPVASVLASPLLLRMVFELYAPDAIPGELHAFRLYDEYWDARVRRDRRSAETGSGPDLSSETQTLAAWMLGRGSPETSQREAETWVSDGTLATLIDRGVLKTSEIGTVAFFHQTFFEHAAGRWFAAQGATGLDLLRARMSAVPHDLFTSPVYEQAILQTERFDADAADSALLTLLRGGVVARLSGVYVFTHRNRVGEEAVGALRELLHDPDGVVTQQFLDHASNAPRERVPEMIDLLAVVWDTGRWRERVKVVGLLARYASREPEAVAAFLAERDPVAELLTNLSAAGPPAADYVLAVTRVAKLQGLEARAIDGVQRLARAAAAAGVVGVLVKVFDTLAALGGPVARAAAERLAECAEDGGGAATAAFGRLLAADCRRAGVTAVELVTELEKNPPKHAAHAQLVAVGELLAEGERADPDELWELWHGLPRDLWWRWSPVVWRRVLSSPHADEELAAKLARRLGDALAALEGDLFRTARETFVAVTEEGGDGSALLFAPTLAAPEPWLDSQRLGPALRAGVRVAHPGALEALAAVERDPERVDQRILQASRQALAHHAHEDPKAVEALVRLSLREEDVRVISNLVAEHAWKWPVVFAEHADALAKRCIELTAHPDGVRRHHGYRLWQALVAAGALPTPDPSDMIERLRRESYPQAAHHLVLLAAEGSTREGMAGDLVSAILERAEAAESPTVTEAARDATCVIASRHWRELGLERVVSLLLQPPVGARRVARIGDVLEAAGPDAAAAAEALVELLRGAADAGMGRPAQRDAAALLRKPVRLLFRQLDAATRRRTLAAVEHLPAPLGRPIVEAAFGVHGEEMTPALNALLENRAVTSELHELIRNQKSARQQQGTEWHALLEQLGG